MIAKIEKLQSHFQQLKRKNPVISEKNKVKLAQGVQEAFLYYLVCLFYKVEKHISDHKPTQNITEMKSRFSIDGFVSSQSDYSSFYLSLFRSKNW